MKKDKRNLLDIKAKDLDKLAVEYNKTKDPLIRKEWFRLVRSLYYPSSHKQTLDTILKPPPPALQKVRHHIK